jgi:hypothetical protein
MDKLSTPQSFYEGIEQFEKFVKPPQLSFTHLRELKKSFQYLAQFDKSYINRQNTEMSSFILPALVSVKALLTSLIQFNSPKKGT